MPLCCPACASLDVQKVLLVYSSGTNTILAATTGIGAGGLGVGTTFGVSQSQLAGRLAPPPRKQPNGMFRAIFAGIFLAVVLGPFFDSTILFGTAFLSGFWGAYVIKKEAARYNEEEYPALYQQWAKRFVCLRCGLVFEPESGAINIAAHVPALPTAGTEPAHVAAAPTAVAIPLLPAFHVRLVSPGERTIALVEAIQELLGNRISDAKAIVERAPCLVRTYDTQAQAEAARAKLAKVGAVVVVDRGRSESAN